MLIVPHCTYYNAMQLRYQYHNPLQSNCITDTAQCNGLLLKFILLHTAMQYGQGRNRNSTTATHSNADAVDYERSLTVYKYILGFCCTDTH